MKQIQTLDTSYFSNMGLNLDAAYITAPIPKRAEISIPYGDGVIDALSQLANVYEERVLTLIFTVFSAARWFYYFPRLMATLSTSNQQIITPDKISYAWHGNLNLVSAGNRAGDKVVFSANVSPYRMLCEPIISTPADQEKTIRIFNAGVCPVVPVIRTSAPTATLTHGKVSVTVHQGGTPVPEFTIPPRSSIQLGYEIANFTVETVEGIL